jgi:hypothetical protein
MKSIEAKGSWQRTIHQSLQPMQEDESIEDNSHEMDFARFVIILNHFQMKSMRARGSGQRTMRKSLQPMQEGESIGDHCQKRP